MLKWIAGRREETEKGREAEGRGALGAGKGLRLCSVVRHTTLKVDTLLQINSSGKCLKHSF